MSIVVCGAGPASKVERAVILAQDRGWLVRLVATPAALPFLDVAELEALTGNPVRSDYQMSEPGRVRSLPDAVAYVVAPATYNTVCKLALGISDTYPLGVLA